MTVRTLLKFVECPVEIRSGRGRKAHKVPPCRNEDHLSEEVTRIIPRGAKLVICSEVPDYELDVDVGEDLTEDDLPWE